MAGAGVVKRAAPNRTAARGVDRTSPLPLWAQLYEDLVRRLEAGAFGEEFPGEHELTEQYQVSRHTVREALRRLRQAGVLESGRGRRTAVPKARIEQPLGALYSLFSVVQARGVRQRGEVLERGLRRDVAARLGPGRRPGLPGADPAYQMRVATGATAGR